MRSALLISFGFHIAVGLIWMRMVKITQVRFIPRDVITVQILTVEEAQAKPAPPVIKDPKPPPPQPVIEEVPEEVIAPPEDKKPPPPKKEEKKEVKKTLPKPELKKTNEVPSAEVDPDPAPAQTGEMALDTEDFPYHYYLMTMKRKIASFWRVPSTSAGQDRYCVVYFKVQRSGSVGTPVVETSSGNIVFDQAALRAVVQANPLPPLPPGYPDNQLGVHFSFTYED